MLATMPAGGMASDGRSSPVLSPASCSTPNRDFNFDGSIDFCDLAIFINYFYAHDPRADIDGNGAWNAWDLKLFEGCICSGPAQPVTTSSATIGVYFDPDGTVRQLDNVAPDTNVHLYVVAKNVTSAGGIGGYTFWIDFGGASLAYAEYPPAGTVNLQRVYATEGTCIRSGGVLCPPATGPVVLMHYVIDYSGVHNSIIGLQGVSDCQAPMLYPAYVSCDTTCQWSYFDPTAIGRAVINGEDFDGDGTADIFENYGTRYYAVRGTSNGVGWSTGIRQSGGTGWNHSTLVGALPVGALAADFVTAFITSLTSLSPSVRAGIWGDPTQFYVSVPGGPNFELGVGPAAGPNCWIPTFPSCHFNPAIIEIGDPATAVPDRLAFSLRIRPNPFNPRTTIQFVLPSTGHVLLAIYDLAGRLVRVLVEGEIPAGSHEAVWDGRDASGRAAPSGSYLARLVAGGKVEGVRLSLVR
jgi:hypothetical protein